MTLQIKLLLALAAAAVIALFLLALSQRYHLTPPTSQRPYTLLLDRWTGNVQICTVGRACFDMEKGP